MLTNNHAQQLVSIILMMALALYVQELPSSNVLQTALPEWPLILNIYFAVSSRYFYGVISAFVVGIIQDVFLGSIIGLHAGIYVIIAFIMLTIRLRFKHMSIFTQALLIGLLVFAKVLIVGIYETLLYSPPAHLWVILSIPLSMLLWPLVHMFFSFFAGKHI